MNVFAKSWHVPGLTVDIKTHSVSPKIMFLSEFYDLQSFESNYKMTIVESNYDNKHHSNTCLKPLQLYIKGYYSILASNLLTKFPNDFLSYTGLKESHSLRLWLT